MIRRNPKILVGFSDITGLHIAINQRTGLVTFHSPNPEWGLGVEKNLSPFAAKWFWRALAGQRTMTNHSPSRAAGSATRSNQVPRQPMTPATHKLFDDVPRPITLRGGKARGRLIGGNLSVLHALMGTPYEIETDGKILFLEDVGEAPYRVDRMLSTLRLAGKFDNVAGVILGAFTARENEDQVGRRRHAWTTCCAITSPNSACQCSTHFPVGHVRYNATLPVGAMAELDATGQTLRVLENPVDVPRR